MIKKKNFFLKILILNKKDTQNIKKNLEHIHNILKNKNLLKRDNNFLKKYCKIDLLFL